CPRHRVFLLQSCPACQRPIPTPRSPLSTCPFCGGDYRLQVLPLSSEADWLLNIHLTFLTHLGVDSNELGGLSANQEPSLLQDLSSSEYLWIVVQFLSLFERRPRQGKLLPFLLHALPATALVPGTPHNPYVTLHYLLTSWPIHWWVLLERLQQALQHDLLWRRSADTATKIWENHLAEGDCWRQSADKRRTIELLRAFFTAVENYLQRKTHIVIPEDNLEKRVTSCEILLARQLRSPGRTDIVSPYPWEDLISVICRVARNMRYEDPTWLLISQDMPYRKIYSLNIPLLCHHDDYRFL